MVEPPYGSIIDGSNIIYSKNYSYQNLILIGVSMSSVVIENTSAHRNNTVSYDSTTGTFSGTIYSDSSTEPQTAKITYTKAGIDTAYFHSYKITIPELIGANLSNVSITPATVVINNETYHNIITFNKETGSFIGKVYNSSTSSQNYLIEWEI